MLKYLRIDVWHFKEIFVRLYDTEVTTEILVDSN